VGAGTAIYGIQAAVSTHRPTVLPGDRSNKATDRVRRYWKADKARKREVKNRNKKRKTNSARNENYKVSGIKENKSSNVRIT
jgi:hypothetical protein